MKRTFIEISDEEWESHPFKSSRVLKPSQPPPPIESFAFSSDNLSDESIKVLENPVENLEDDNMDYSMEVRKRPGRRFVVDEDIDGDFEKPNEEEEIDEEVEESDVIGKALEQCGKISEELRSELYGSSVVACDRYAEVEASSVRIVTQELWSLLEFMMPDIFETGDVDLKKIFNSEDRDLISRMKSMLGPFILRRLKSDVMQQLAPKIQKVEYVEMANQQDDAYKETIEEYRAASQPRALKFTETKTSNVAGLLPQRQISNYFVQFRKIANHPLLVRRIYTDEDVVRFAKILHPKGVFGFECTVDRVIEELKSYNDFSIHRLLLYNGVSDTKGVLSDDHDMISAKCRALARLLPLLKGREHRIFSQWTSMLDILEWTLEVIGVMYRLDGSTQVIDRQTIVDTFNNDASIFACLLSTRAAGQGLNLTGADTVIIHDMDFNPPIDRQAEDRCHCIGQTKPVTIYRLVTKGTVDENVYEIAKRKLVLDEAVLESVEEVDNEGDVADKTMGEILSTLLLG